MIALWIVFYILIGVRVVAGILPVEEWLWIENVGEIFGTMGLILLWPFLLWAILLEKIT